MLNKKTSHRYFSFIIFSPSCNRNNEFVQNSERKKDKK